MERNEFRERMNQFKKARETNPLLSYWEWKNSLPDNLANTPDWQYNNIGAWAGGLEPELYEDGYYHLGSRNPQTGEILKPKSHPTYQKAIESDIAGGYFPYEKKGRTYTKTYAPTGDLSGYAYGTSGIGNDDSFRYVDNPSILNAAIDLFNLGKITQDQFLKTQDHLNALKNKSEETKQVSQEIDNARQWSIDWLNKRKATGKFEDQLTDDYMLFATNRFKNVMIDVSSSPRNLSNDANGNFFAPPTKGGVGGINIRYNPNIDYLTKYSQNRNSNIIHEIAHAGTIFKNRKYSDEDWNNIYSPQIILINKLLGAPLTTTSSSVSLGDYAGSAPEIYARLQQMRWAMKADPTRINYTYDELKPYLNIFLLDFGKEKTEALMNTIAFNQNNNSTSEFDNFVDDPQDVISPYNLRKDVLHVAKGGIIGYDDGTDGIKMTPEQEKKFLEDRQKYAAMSGAISPVLDIRTAADFTPIGNAIASKEIYDATSSGNYLDAGLIGASLVVPPALAKPIKRYIPTVSRTVANKINKLLDNSNAIKETEWNNTVNRAIERIYDKDVRDRAALIKAKYGVDILSLYDAIDDLYTNNYESIPKAKIMLMEDGARAKMHTKPLASKAWATEGKPADMKDFEMQVRPDVEPSKEVAEHEVNHWWTYSMMQNPDWRRSELLKITKDFEGALHKTNLLDPDNSNYYRDWMELNAYGINVVNSMKELSIPFTKENVIKFINLKPDTSALKRAARQFKNMDLYYDWLRTMPLAGMAGAAYMLGNKEDNSYSGGTEGVGLPKYYGAYDPKQLAYVLPVDKNAGVVLPEVEITPQNNTDLAGYMLKGDLVKEAAAFTPVGDVMDLYLIVKDAYNGNYGLAALGAGLFFLPDIIAKPISKGIRKLGKNLTAKKRSDKLFREIDSLRGDISRKESQLYLEYTFNKLREIVDKKELQVILDDPSNTVNRRRLNGLKFRDIYKKYLNQAANLSLSVDTKESLEGLSIELKNLFMKLLWDDPQYIKFAQSKNLPFDSLDTVDKWIEKQRTSIRGVYSEKPDATIEDLKDMFTVTKKSNPGGDRLRTNGGLYVSNSDEIANRFSRSQNDSPGTAAYAILKSPDIDRTLPIDSQLAELRRRIFPYDFHSNFDDFNYQLMTPERLLDKGYIGKQSLYTMGNGELLPAYETAFFSKEPNTKVADIYDYATSDITKNIAGRWGKGAGGADIDDDLYSPRLFGQSFGDFNREYRTYMETLPNRERLEKTLSDEDYRKLYQKEFDIYFGESESKHKELHERDNILIDRRNNLYNTMQLFYQNERKINKIKPWLNSSVITGGAIAAGYGITNLYENDQDKLIYEFNISDDLNNEKININDLDIREKQRLLNLHGSLHGLEEYKKYLKKLKDKYKSN